MRDKGVVVPCQSTVTWRCIGRYLVVKLHIFWLQHWMKVNGQLHAQAALSTGKYPDYSGEEAGRAQKPV